MATMAVAGTATGPLQGRRILVTGASSGIGAATARAIVAAGGSVALLARREAVLDELADELRAEAAGESQAAAGSAEDAAAEPPSSGAAAPTTTDRAPRVVVVATDVVDPDACRRAVAQAAEELGGLDGLINAAGVLRPGSTLDGDPADWQLMFDVNVRGLLHVTTAAADALRAAAAVGGIVDVVNISSLSGRRLGSTPMAAYAASKAAVHMLSEGMRREFAEHGVRLAVVSPGVVATGLFAGDDDMTAKLAAKADEAGLDADDVARAVVGLLAAPGHVVHDELALRHVGQ
jgi:clavulanate-9-aldehyde reducatase